MQHRSLGILICALALSWCGTAGAQVWSLEKSQIADFYGAAAVTAKPQAVTPVRCIQHRSVACL